MSKLTLPYSNEIGLVNSTEVVVHRLLLKRTVPMADLKRIGLYKRSSLRKNIAIYLASFAVLMYYLYFYNQLSDLKGISLIVTVIVGFFYAFFGKFYHYTLVFHCKGYMVKLRYSESKKEALQLFQQAINLAIHEMHPEAFSAFDVVTAELNS